MDLNLFETINIDENISVTLFSGESLSQSGLTLTNGLVYKISFNLHKNLNSVLLLLEDSSLLTTFSSNGYNEFFFFSNGGSKITFTPSVNFSGYIDNVSLTQVSINVKEFLTGETDEGQAIVFRADTQIFQVQNNPEMYSVPISISTEMERGTTTKVFVSLNDEQFYQLDGTATKGNSILKLDSHSADETTPTMVQSIQLSYRDSSKQLCRINQIAITSLPTTINTSQ